MVLSVWKYVTDAGRFQGLWILGAKWKSGGFGRYECKRVKVFMHRIQGVSLTNVQMWLSRAHTFSRCGESHLMKEQWTKQTDSEDCQNRWLVLMLQVACLSTSSVCVCVCVCACLISCKPAYILKMVSQVCFSFPRRDFVKLKKTHKNFYQCTWAASCFVSIENFAALPILLTFIWFIWCILCA